MAYIKKKRSWPRHAEGVTVLDRVRVHCQWKAVSTMNLSDVLGHAPVQKFRQVLVQAFYRSTQGYLALHDNRIDSPSLGICWQYKTHESLIIQIQLSMQ